mmetsp:Transcript_99506/g.276916  ORF Transcript_99506/g.276916 Transcript_99506/m.276916 type:complete len:252 (+) Transcript_99506:407-1162(+)
MLPPRRDAHTVEGSVACDPSPRLALSGIGLRDTVAAPDGSGEAPARPRAPVLVPACEAAVGPCGERVLRHNGRGKLPSPATARWFMKLESSFISRSCELDSDRAMAAGMLLLRGSSTLISHWNLRFLPAPEELSQTTATLPPTAAQESSGHCSPAGTWTQSSRVCSNAACRPGQPPASSSRAQRTGTSAGGPSGGVPQPSASNWAAPTASTTRRPKARNAAGFAGGGVLPRSNCLASFSYKCESSASKKLL